MPHRSLAVRALFKLLPRQFQELEMTLKN